MPSRKAPTFRPGSPKWPRLELYRRESLFNTGKHWPSCSYRPRPAKRHSTQLKDPVRATATLRTPRERPSAETVRIAYNPETILLDLGAPSRRARTWNGPASESGVGRDRVPLQAARVDAVRPPRHHGGRGRGRAPVGRPRRSLHEPRRNQGGLPDPARGARLRSPARRAIRALP